MARFGKTVLGFTIASIVTGGLLATGSSTPAAATPAQCDAGKPLDVYGVVGGGSSFTYAGRTVHLLNGRARNYTYGEISRGYHQGDRIWVDRSKNKMPKTPMHPTTQQVISAGGWKQCGPFSGPSSNAVINWNTSTVSHYAARVCIDPAGSTPYHCGAWYTDAS
ncbi:hypothetical protein [Amycolatopsis sp. NPDC021455]|uniref:hypothetical protein n=1 Tax=Amycolatopsis sp. NPDC021455 TaxID=3154901 RepID=UPI0033DB0EC9